MSMEAKSDKEPTRVDRMERWFRNQPILAVVIVVGLIIIAASEVVQHWSDLMIRLGITEEKTLQLSTSNAKGELSRALVTLASKRIFWTRNYYTRVELGRASDDIDYSWNKHIETVAEWSAQYITNLNAIAEYYPKSEKSSQFDHIHDEFRDLEGNLAELRNTELAFRHGALPLNLKTATKRVEDLLKLIKTQTDQVNVDVFFFALNRPEPKRQ